MTEFTRQSMTLHLQALKRINPDNAPVCYGICDLWWLEGVQRPNRQLKQALFRTWDEYSGDSLFPVPSYADNVSPEDSYENHEDMFGEHPYGQARRRLLAHMIKTLEECLEC